LQPPKGSQRNEKVRNGEEEKKYKREERGVPGGGEKMAHAGKHPEWGK